MNAEHDANAAPQFRKPTRTHHAMGAHRSASAMSRDAVGGSALHGDDRWLSAPDAEVPPNFLK
jgi:hypothetical protein